MHHNTTAGFGSIERGQSREIRGNTNRLRLNIQGVSESSTPSAIAGDDESVNTRPAIALFQQIEARKLQAERIHIIFDNAQYFQATPVKADPDRSKIDRVVLPPDAPDPGLIQRFWRFIETIVLYGRYYENCHECKIVCDDLSACLGRHDSL